LNNGQRDGFRQRNSAGAKERGKQSLTSDEQKDRRDDDRKATMSSEYPSAWKSAFSVLPKAFIRRRAQFQSQLTENNVMTTW